MKVYKSFAEKSEYFNQGSIKINTDEDFNIYTKQLMNHNSKEDFIFRGVSEAKYKLYNSAQRDWANNKTFNKHQESQYNDHIHKQINICKNWNNNTIQKLFNTYNISEKNSIAYLAYMQHYEIPTPLLDFTQNVHNAFFFAINEIDYTKESHNEMDNYFSIYSTYQNNTLYEEFYKTFVNVRNLEQYGEFDYDNIVKSGLILISDRIREHKIINNIRIVNQEGLFFYNSSLCDPIEYVYRDFFLRLREKLTQKKIRELLIHEKFAVCYNFHKKFAKQINDILLKKEITLDFIYPNNKNLKEYCAKSTL